MKVFEESVLENGLVKCQIVDTVLGNIITEFYTNLNDLDTMVDMEGISYVNLPATFYNNISTSFVPQYHLHFKSFYNFSAQKFTAARRKSAQPSCSLS